MNRFFPTLSIALAVTCLAFLSIVQPVRAQVSSVNGNERIGAADAMDFLRKTDKTTGLPQDNATDATGKLINRILGASGIAFLILTVYAGFMWMTAQGNQDRITKARETLTASGIGIAVILLAFSITNFVLNNVSSAVSGGGGRSGQPQGPLGCCLTEFNPNAFAGDGWAYKITDSASCSQSAGEDRHEFYEGMDAVTCQNRWNEKNEE